MLTAAMEADCCHCLVFTVDGSTGADGGGSGAATAGDGRRGGSTRYRQRCGQTWRQRHFDCRRGGGLPLPLPRCHRRREARERTEVAVAVRLPAMMDAQAATLRLPSLPRVSVDAAMATDRGCGAAGGSGGVGRCGGRDTSTAATEADCCHCLVVTVDGSMGDASTVCVEAATLRLPPFPRVSVNTSATADGAGSGAAVGGGSVGRRGGRDTSTAATEAETFRLRWQWGRRSM